MLAPKTKIRRFVDQLLLKFYLSFNRVLKDLGQNAYCKKGDAKTLIKAFGYQFRDNPKMRTRVQELLDDIEELKL